MFWKRQKLWWAGSLCFPFPQQWKSLLSHVASCHLFFFFPWQLFFHFSSSSCSYLLMNKKFLFLHGMRVSWGQNFQLEYCMLQLVHLRDKTSSFQYRNVAHACCSSSESKWNAEPNPRFSKSIVEMLVVLPSRLAGPFACSQLQTISQMSVDFEWIFGCEHTLHLDHSYRGSWLWANGPPQS